MVLNEVVKRPLMLTKDEVEAVARHRVAKRSSKTTNTMLLFILIFALAGFFLYKSVSMWGGIALVVVAGIILVWQFYFVLPKKQKTEQKMLVQLWREQK